MRIDIWSMIALIDPALPVLERHLEYRIKRFKEGGPLGYQQREEAMPIWGFDIKDRMAVPAGLVPRVRQVLAEYGYHVKLTDHRKFTERFAVDEKFVRRLQGDDRRLVDAVRREPLGQIEVNSFTDMILTMRLLVYVYPKARVLILVATKTLARKIRTKLYDMAFGFDVQLMGHGWPRVSPRCMVSTFAPMDTFRPDAWDVILLPDPSGTVGDWNTGAMARLHNYSDKESLRLYSFLQPGTRLGRRGRVRLEAMAGQMIYRLGPEHAGVRVLWLPTPDAPKIGKDVPALTFKRKAYWRNRNRNDYIAAVARAFLNRDAGKLAEYGVPFRGHKPVLRNAPDTKVAVLVASVEQAREVANRLPGWKVVDAVVTETLGTIITETVAGKDGLAADVVIRAGGSMGVVCFKGFPPALDKDKRDAILVDFTDGFDERAAQDAKRRRREYELLGWESEPEPGKEAVALSK